MTDLEISLILPFAIYPTIGFMQAFAVWIVNEDEKINLYEYTFFVVAWPILWLFMPSLKEMLELVKNNPQLFAKSILAQLSIAIIIYKLMER